MYRRPLPTTNLPFLSAVMFDGRGSSPATGTTKTLYGNYPTSLLNDLAHQSVDATLCLEDLPLVPNRRFLEQLATAGGWSI